MSDELDKGPTRIRGLRAVEVGIDECRKSRNAADEEEEGAKPTHLESELRYSERNREIRKKVEGGQK